MPTKKIADLPTPRRCQDPQHAPPAHECWPPGIYEHTCPSCGAQSRFRVDPSIDADPGAFRATACAPFRSWIPPIEGPAAAAREWVRRFGSKETP